MATAMVWAWTSRPTYLIVWAVGDGFIMALSWLVWRSNPANHYFMALGSAAADSNPRPNDPSPTLNPTSSHRARRFCACPEFGADYSPRMSTVHEIENAVSNLSRDELLSFRDWFSTFDAAAWDKQFEQDVAAGHLDALADEAIRDLREGRCRDL